MQITVNSRKYDGSVRRSWQCDLVEQTETLIKAVGTFAEAVEHPDLGSITKGTISYEFYWPDRWYSIFRFHEPDGSLRNLYCNINLPPVLNGDTLDYVDLDIDVVVWPDGRLFVLDEAEFEVNRERYGYTEEIIAEVRRTLDELLAASRSGGLDKLLET